MGGRTSAAAAAVAAIALVSRGALATTLEPHADVRGADVTAAEVRSAGGAWRSVAWDDLDGTRLDPGPYEVRVHLDATGDAAGVLAPHCAGRQRVVLDGREVAAAVGPVAVPLAPGKHELALAVTVSKYERRIACSGAPRQGALVRTQEGLGELAFASPYGPKGGGRAVVYVPPGHDLGKPSPLLVGVHPWNGSMWTYAAYAQLLREARTRDLVLLMPSGLGNSLYVADAEDEVMRALDAVGSVVAVDPRAVSIWGASMGGAGATTIGFHHPDRFAGVVSFFGDSKYDVTSYVRSILPDDPSAHLVNALDVVDNARNLPVWLVHGEDDATSPIRQSEMLAQAMGALGYDVRFDRVPRMGHAGALVARFLPGVVGFAAGARVPAAPKRVTYRSVRSWDTEAYGVHLVRSSPSGDAFVDVERGADSVHVRRAQGLRALVLDRGALGTPPDRPPPIVVDGGSALEARWAEAAP
ncbi:MAG TPA: prolyl oligopeptidase family serine peptidase [Polyangiaceae bacterium]